MREQGVAGLSLGEVARRLGIRPPSLYVYFASKNALYDAAFARGAQELLDIISAEHDRVFDEARSLHDVLLRVASTFITWAIDNPVYSQLLFWRTVPGFEPSPDAYRPAVELIDITTALFSELQARGWLRDDAAVADLLRDWTIITSGIVSQQLANAPEESFDRGRFTTALPGMVAMFVATNAAPVSTRKSNRKPVTGRESRNAHRR
jgi:AcrR family transcriptional regulator